MCFSSTFILRGRREQTTSPTFHQIVCTFILRGRSKTQISFSINFMYGITMRKAYKMNLQNYKNASKFCHPLTFLDCISTRFPYSVLALAIEMKLHHNLLLTLTCYYVKNPAGVHMVEFDMF